MKTAYTVIAGSRKAAMVARRRWITGVLLWPERPWWGRGGGAGRSEAADRSHHGWSGAGLLRGRRGLDVLERLRGGLLAQQIGLDLRADLGLGGGAVPGVGGQDPVTAVLEGVGEGRGLGALRRAAAGERRLGVLGVEVLGEVLALRPELHVLACRVTLLRLG